MYKPNLVCDAVEEKIQFPVMMQPKIDGVRGLGDYKKLVGRSLKPIANRYLQAFFSHHELTGLDGELAADHECHPDLCRITTSATSSYDGQPFVLWWVFDYVTADTKDLPYVKRYEILKAHVARLQAIPMYQPWAGHLRVMPMKIVYNLEQCLAQDTEWLELGFEGSIGRGLANAHKQGRSTVKEGGAWRIKRFVEEDAVVLSIQEGQRNDNEAQTNELGKTFRSSHQENMVPNGMVGALECRDKKTNAVITVGAGRLTHAERLHFFNNQAELIGRTIKYKRFPKGVKDKPRFPTFQCLRSETDI